MSFTEEQLSELRAPLAREHIKQREQAGRKFSYIEGWHVIAEANRIFGFDAWDRETIEIKCVAEVAAKIGQQQRDGWRVGYICKVRITVRPANQTDRGSFVVREGSGYGSGIDVDLGQAHESALKEAETDAMKRALMTFGNPMGLALYDKEQANVEAPPARAAAQRPSTQSHQPARPIERQAAADDPKLVTAREAYMRLHKALEIADTLSAVDQIIKVNTNDLLKVKLAHAESYDLLMTFANSRKQEFLAAA